MADARKNKYTSSTVVAVIVANMVGTGVFTSLGFQLVEIQSGFALLLLWAVGGLIALCGAMTYAELGAALPRSGGEYNFLSRIYHPAAGFVSAWVSSTIGFSAPSALAAMTFAAYATSIFPAIGGAWVEKTLAVLLVLSLALVHSRSRRQSGGLQGVFTLLKIAVIVGFCVAAIASVQFLQPIQFAPHATDIDVIGSGAFAISLIYVSYAYTGWNAATYLSGEMHQPQRNLPVVLFLGTAVVTVLYLALNAVFLSVAPISAMTGELEIGFIAAQFAFGDSVAQFAGLVLALLLISTVSAMTLAGPRVLQVVGQDFSMLKVLATENADGLPYIAIIAQTVLTIVFIITGSFESILVFAGFTLALNSLVTVVGVFVLRARQPDLPRPYRTFAYPLTPLVYIALTVWTLGYVVFTRPQETLVAAGLIVTGLVVYGVSASKERRQ